MRDEHRGYFALIRKTLDKIRTIDIHKFADLLLFSKTVWIVGNGGSMANGIHMAEDLCKSAGVRAVALSDSALLTASANDCGYENSFYTGLKTLVDAADDAVIGISVSGKSKNILRAFDLGCKKLALVGVKGSPLDKKADFSIAVGSNDFKLVEDVHAILCHRIVYEIERRKNR